MKLHTKTTILISVITVAVMLATVLLIGVRMVSLVQGDEQELAQFQALSLAEQISLMPTPRDEEDLARAIAQARGARPNVTAVRIWNYSAAGLSEYRSSPGSLPAEPITEETIKSFRAAPTPNVVRSLPAQTFVHNGEAFYRVLAPIREKGTLVGVVAITERLNDVPSIVKQYAWNALWLTLVAVGLITVATYLSFRNLVYAPLERLLQTIAGMSTDDSTEDELGRASKEYERMLEQLQTLTAERERQKEVLRERVQEATQELQHRNEQLTEANRELWETSRRLSQMERLAIAGQTAAQFAHEVGTPLSTISIHAELLRETVQTMPDALRRTNIIGEQIERIERIVRGMLDRTRIEKPVLQPLDLGTLLQHIGETMEPSLTVRNVNLLTTLPTQPLLVVGDGDRLQQVFINLINNAMDAMPDGGELRLSACTENDDVVVALTDTGAGMDAETQARIFDALYTTKQRGRGTGFGLVVVKQILEEHHSKITVESRLGHGSTFRLTFPTIRNDYETNSHC